MDLQSIFDQVYSACASNPIVCGVVAAVLLLVRNGTLKLPFNVPLLTPKVESLPDTAAVLRDRLRGKVADRLDELIGEGYDEDDAYIFLITQVRDRNPAEEEE